MSESVGSGCRSWWIWLLVFAALSFATMIYHPGGGRIAQEASATPSPYLTATPLTLAVPTPQGSFPFAVQDNQITYIYRATLDWPCNYLISGYVLDRQGNPFTNFVVNIRMLALESADSPLAHQHPNSDSSWTALLVSWEVPYEIWLSTGVDGEAISPHVYIPPQDCEHNEAIVGFIQAAPLP